MTDLFASVTADTLKILGVSATYQPLNGITVDVHVIRTDNVEAVGEYGHVIHKGTVFDVARADVDQPTQGDLIMIGLDEWEVQEIVEQDQHLSRVAVRG